MKRVLQFTAIFAICLFLLPLPGQAVLLDLTAGGNGYINSAFFTTSDDQSTGTGVIQSFVRIQATGNAITEQGYNTDGRPVQYDENTSPTFTRSLLLSAVPVVNIGGTDYREFLLDINQTNANPLLSLDAIKLYLQDTGDIINDSLFGAPLYNLDAGGDNYLRLNYSLNSGSGSGDLFMYIPNNLFTGSNQYVYLYSQFGLNNEANDGFEEWAVRKPGPPPPSVPEPATMLLLGLGLIVITSYGRKKLK